MMINILGTVAQWEREMISERTSTAMQYLKTQGAWMGRIPYGFKIEDGKLVEDEDQMARIKAMKLAHRRGRSIRAIAASHAVSPGLVHRLVRTDMRQLRSMLRP